MFSIGDMIVYGISGIYTIEDICEQTVIDKPRTYYILNSSSGTQSRIFVPVDSEALVSSMRHLLSADEVSRIISEMHKIEPAPWYNESRKRSESFRTLMESGDPRAVLSVIKAILKNAKERREAGKKIYMTDENTLLKAEKLIYSEFSCVLGIEESEISERVRAAME